MSSLLQQVESKRNIFNAGKGGEETDNSAEKRLNQTQDLLRILNQIMTLQLISKKSKTQWAKHRTKLDDCKFELHNLQGNVTESGWANMVGCAIEGMMKTINHTQPNGVWKISDYEVAIKTDADNIECIRMAVQFIDADNQPDLMYRNGVPETMNVNVNTDGLSKDIMTALQSKSGGDDELKGLLKQLIGVMASNATTQDAPTPPKKKSKKNPVLETIEESFIADGGEAAPVVFDD